MRGYATLAEANDEGSRTDQEDSPVELRDYVRILHKSWVLIVASMLLGIGVAALYSIVVTPKYEAATELYVSVRSGDSAASGDLVQGTNFARQAVTSYVDVVDSAIVLDRVIAQLELDQTSAQLAEQIEASSPLNTVLILSLIHI